MEMSDPMPLALSYTDTPLHGSDKDLNVSVTVTLL